MIEVRIPIGTDIKIPFIILNSHNGAVDLTNSPDITVTVKADYNSSTALFQLNNSVSTEVEVIRANKGNIVIKVTRSQTLAMNKNSVHFVDVLTNVDDITYNQLFVILTSYVVNDTGVVVSPIVTQQKILRVTVEYPDTVTVEDKLNWINSASISASITSGVLTVLSSSEFTHAHNVTSNLAISPKGRIDESTSKATFIGWGVGYKGTVWVTDF